jgi:DNA-binding beta-propeller fold protein YncE
MLRGGGGRRRAGCFVAQPARGVAVLGDALHRVSVLGGRDGMPRSLGSAYSGAVALFLGGVQGAVRRIIATPGVKSDFNGVAVSRDGSTLLVSDLSGGSHAIHVFSVADGSLLRVVGRQGSGPLQFHYPRQVWIASDDFVFVTECHNCRVQVLTPDLDFHGFVGVGKLTNPAGACANADVVVVSEALPEHRIAVFNRADGAVLRRFGSKGRGNDELNYPLGLCFVSGGRHIAVTDHYNDRVSVFTTDGDFVRHVGVGVLCRPHGVACSDYDELVVADTDNSSIVVFSESGETYRSIGSGRFTGVAVHRSGTVFAQDVYAHQCVVLV